MNGEEKIHASREKKKKKTLVDHKNRSNFYLIPREWFSTEEKLAHSDDSSRDFHGEPTGCSQKETSLNSFVPSKELSNLPFIRKRWLENDSSRLRAQSFDWPFLQIRNGYDPLCRWQPWKKKRILAHLFIPWAFKDRARHFLPLILDRRGEEWKNAFDRRRSYLMYIRWSRKGNHDDTGNPLRFWGRCSIVWYIGYGGRKKNSFPHNFNTVFVVMGEGGIPQTLPVFLLLKEFIFWEWSMIMPRFIFIRNSIFFLRLYSLLRMVDFRNFNEIIFCFYVLKQFSRFSFLWCFSLN